MKTLFIFILIFTFSVAGAQNDPSFSNIPLVSSTDYANAEESALNAADLILSTPINKDSKSINEAAQFLVEWMKGTPDYTFPLNEPIGTISQENPNLLVVFMAGMTKYVLKNKGNKKLDQDKISLNGFRMLADYCANPDNHVKIQGELENLIKANKEGNLEDYLDEFDAESEGSEV